MPSQLTIYGEPVTCEMFNIILAPTYFEVYELQAFTETTMWRNVLGILFRNIYTNQTYCLTTYIDDIGLTIDNYRHMLIREICARIIDHGRHQDNSDTITTAKNTFNRRLFI